MNNLNISKDHDDVDCNKHFGDYLSSLRKNNLNRLIFAHLNINSIRNKFDQLVNGIKGNIDILIMISETKLDDSFPSMQILIEGFGPPFRSDRNSHGGGILVYGREDIPCKLIPMKNCSIEGFFIELNLKSKKWLISCSYNPHRNFISHHLNSTNLDLISRNYEGFEGFGPPFRSDRNSHGGGILVYGREDIPCKLIPMKNCSIEGFFIELNLKSKKWLISCSYNPHRNFISHHLNSTNLDLISRNYENIFLMGDFNALKIHLKIMF